MMNSRLKIAFALGAVVFDSRRLFDAASPQQQSGRGWRYGRSTGFCVFNAYVLLAANSRLQLSAASGVVEASTGKQSRRRQGTKGMLMHFALRVVCGSIALTTPAWSQQAPLIGGASGIPYRAAEQASEGERARRGPPALDIVRDDAGVLSGEEDRNLTAFLDQILDQTGVKVFVVLVPSTGPETSERYGGRLVEYWAKRGALNPAKTVVAVLAVEDRHLSVLAGRGLPSLQRELAGGGALSFVVPYLKDERYFEAMMALSRWLSGRLTSRGRST